ncbi:hypothetical protein [Nostoc sp.]|uniref:hypothetical protein n=1 Tax=Nostoc sp. TaxID=1180 RepID=UPI002FFD165C
MHSLREATPTPTQCGYFTADTHATLFLTNQRGTENTEDEESDRSLGVLDIAFFFRAKSQRNDRLLQIFYTCTM